MSLLLRCSVTLAAIVAASSATQVDISTQNLTPVETPRALQSKSIEPTAKGLLALGLLVPTAALFKHGLEYTQLSKQQGIERRDGHHHVYDEYHQEKPNFFQNYARNVKAFEDRTIGRYFRALQQANRRVSTRVGNRWGRMMDLAGHKLRRAGRKFATGVVRTGVNARNTAREALVSTRHRMQRMGRVAKANARSLKLGVQRIANRASQRSNQLRQNIVHTGRHAVAVARSGANGAKQRLSKLRRNLRRVGTALSDRVSIASRRISGSLYKRLRRRRNYNYQRLYSNIYDGVARIGSAVATSASDSVDRIGEVARALPDGLAYVAKEKSIQDCLLQTMCYISTPYLDKNSVKRRKRSVLPDQDKLDELGVKRAFRIEPGEDEAEARQALSRLMDDCEVFKCQVAALGRQAYDGWSRSTYQ